MNLRKYSFIALAASGMLLASCASNTISKEKAVKWAEDHFTSTETKKVKTSHVDYSASAKNDESKGLALMFAGMFGLTEEDLGKDFKYNGENKNQYIYTEPVIPINKEYVEQCSDTDDTKFTFSLSNKQLSIKGTGKMEEAMAGASGTMIDTFDEHGYSIKQKVSFSIKGEVEVPEVGTYNLDLAINYTLTNTVE